MSFPHHHESAGFTLIELLVTLAILAALAATTVPLAAVQQQRQQEAELRRALHDIRSAIDAYKRASDEGRVPREAGASGFPPNLLVLVDGVEDSRSPTRARLYFLRRLPRDPFHPEPDDPPAETWGLRAYASEPDDPQPGEDVYDIFSRSDRIGLNGVPLKAW